MHERERGRGRGIRAYDTQMMWADPFPGALRDCVLTKYALPSACNAASGTGKRGSTPAKGPLACTRAIA